jgi:hypothetical protein
MKTFHRHGSRRLAGLLGTTGALGLLAMPMQAWAGPWNQPYGRPQPVNIQRVPYPVPSAAPYGNGYRADYDTDRYRAYGPVDNEYIQAQTAQRCNVGRLVGGIVGGGLGYAMSRQDGRTWAVPLGALLGQQMGCNVGIQRAPLPW